MIDSRFYEIAGPFSLGELISGLEIEKQLDEAFLGTLISAPGRLATAQASQITFFTNKRRKADLTACEAAACFTTQNLASHVLEREIIPIISKAPRAHFARVVSRFATKKELGGEASFRKSSSARIHETAVIGADAEVGDNAYIGPYSIVGPGVSIGARTILEGHSYIQCASIGSDCRVKAGAQIGGDGFGMDADEKGFVNLPHIGRVIIGDRVYIGSQSCVDRGFLGDTSVGDDVKIDNLVQVAHNCSIGSGTMIAGHVGISGSCIIGKNVRLGGAVGLADHLTIGDNVQIAASSGVMNDIPDGEYWGGTPATPALEQARILAATRRLIKKKK